MKIKILLVDDEPNILEGLRRNITDKNMQVDLAHSGKVALRKMSEGDPYAIIVSDIRMPQMDGVELLKRVKEEYPDTVRMVLTGYADLSAALSVVNEAQVFRIMTKPCSAAVFKETLAQAIRQYELQQSEKVLVHQTLHGTVKVLTEIWSLYDPIASYQIPGIKKVLERLLEHVSVKQKTDLFLALMLGQIGSAVIPAPLLLRERTEDELSEPEKRMLEQVPVTSSEFIQHIPRLENVAHIIRYQEKGFDGSGVPYDEQLKGNDIPIESRMIKIARDYVTLIDKGIKDEFLIARLEETKNLYDPELFEIVKSWHSDAVPAKKVESEFTEYAPHKLSVGQVIFEDVETVDGVLLVPAGTVLSEAMIERIKNYSSVIGLKNPVKIKNIKIEEVIG
ncbi:MAG: response regulator [Candidatus Dadabacteria bacterium]|nr:MAG: response regulator [Candidatus Dadabacteria bacterium]